MSQSVDLISSSGSQIQNQYQVSKIIGRRVRKNGTVQYFVLWKGYSQSQGNWQPEEMLVHAKKKIKQYLRQVRLAQHMKKKRIFNRARARRQKKQYQKQKIQNFEQLKRIVNRQNKNKCKKEQPVQPNAVTTFEKLFNKPADQWMKVQRFRKSYDKYIPKIQQCGQVISKCAALEKRKANLQTNQVEILSFADFQSERYVKFKKNSRIYQCKLSMLRALCPSQIINFLLSRYDPDRNQCKSDAINLDDDLQNYK